MDAGDGQNIAQVKTIRHVPIGYNRHIGPHMLRRPNLGETEHEGKEKRDGVGAAIYLYEGRSPICQVFTAISNAYYRLSGALMDLDICYAIFWIKLVSGTVRSSGR